MSLINFNHTSKTTAFLKTILITIVICFTFLMCGSSRMFTAYLTSQLSKNCSEIKIDEDETSWLGSISSLWNSVGFIYGGFSMELFGRKLSTSTTFLPFIAGWLIITTSKTLFSIYIGVALHGIASGMAMVSSIYVSEISSPKHRGFTLSLLALSYMLGNLICSALQCLISWRLTSMYFLLVSFVMLAVSQFIPESPYWLIMKGLYSEAGAVLESIRSLDTLKSDLIQLEITDIREHVTNKACQNRKQLNWLQKIRYDLISLSSIWKQMVILVVFAVLHKQSGFLPLTQYTVLFFDQLNTPVDGSYASLIHSTVCFMTTSAMPYFVHFYNRRILLCVTSVLAALGMTLTLVYEVALREYPEQTKPYFWLALIGVYGYDAATTIGITSILVMLPAELLPTEFSGCATALYSIITSLITTVISKTYFTVLDRIGLLWLLISFIVCCLFLALLSIVLLPETRGKTLKEIQQTYFNKEAVERNAEPTNTV